jgi:hypothetical protein
MSAMLEAAVASGDLTPRNRGQIQILEAATEPETRRVWYYSPTGRPGSLILGQILGGAVWTHPLGVTKAAAAGTIQVGLPPTEEASRLRLRASVAATGAIRLSPAETDLNSPASPSSQRRGFGVGPLESIAGGDNRVVLTMSSLRGIDLDHQMDWLEVGNNLLEAHTEKAPDLTRKSTSEIEASVASVLANLKALPEDWNAEGGKPMKLRAAEVATTIVSEVAPQLREPPFIYPTQQGGAVLEVQSASDRITIIIDDDFVVGVAFVDDHHYSSEFPISRDGKVGNDAMIWLRRQLRAMGQAGTPV